MKTYNKRTERALIGREKHRILIFGEKICGSKPLNVNLDFCEVEIIPFPSDYRKLKSLSEYTLVILDYCAFSSEDQQTTSYPKEQDIFEAQMLEALNAGTRFCILHYDEIVPEHDGHNVKQGYMDEDDIRKCRRSQIGFRWLDGFSIKVSRVERLIFSDRGTRRNEFRKYMTRWGTTKNLFKPYGEGSFSDIISGLGENYAVAFTLNCRRGKLIYVPCQRDFSRPDTLSAAFTTLIDSLITYLTKSRMELPEWAKVPLFDDERKLAEEKAGLECRLTGYQEKLDIFHSVKQLLFQSEYALEEALPKFLQERCKISTQREETYKEDLWLLDPVAQKVVICEVKSYVKGFKKSGLFNLYNHRESYGSDESFPAVLFVNANLNAASWEQKDRPIDKQDYEEAADKHILIVRIEDLLFAWQALRQGKIDSNKLLDIFQHNVGWLKFKKDRSWEILK